MAENLKHSPWKHPKRWMPLLVTAFLILSFAAYRFSSSSGVKRHVERLRSRGLPTTAVELDRWYTNVPAAENAALAFSDAFRAYFAPGTNNPSEMTAEQLVLGQSLPPKLSDAVVSLLSQNIESIELAHHAAEMRASRYPVDLTKGFETLLPHLAQLKRLTLLMKWDAIQHSRTGNRQKALHSVRSGFAIAASLDNEPLYISALVRIALLNIMLPALERVITEHVLTEDELQTITDLLVRAEQQGRTSLRRGLAGDRGAVIPLFNMDYRTFVGLSTRPTTPPFMQAMPRLIQKASFELARVTGLRDLDLVYSLQRIDEIASALELDYPEMIRRTEEIQARVNQEVPKRPMRYLVSGLILPQAGSGVVKEALLAARFRCARVALAVERYRLNHQDQLPTSLDQLVPKYLPRPLDDPADGNPLSYKTNSSGYSIVARAAGELEKKSKSDPAEFSVLRTGASENDQSH